MVARLKSSSPGVRCGICDQGLLVAGTQLDCETVQQAIQMFEMTLEIDGGRDESFWPERQAPQALTTPTKAHSPISRIAPELFDRVAPDGTFWSQEIELVVPQRP
jgi:hypothetical protein